jgi:hypothetical protein
MPLGPQPSQECLQILGDGLVEHLLFRLSVAVSVGLAVEDSTLHALPIGRLATKVSILTNFSSLALVLKHREMIACLAIAMSHSTAPEA